MHHTIIQCAKHKKQSPYFRAMKETREKRKRKRQGHDSDPINVMLCLSKGEPSSIRCSKQQAAFFKALKELKFNGIHSLLLQNELCHLTAV